MLRFFCHTEMNGAEEMAALFRHLFRAVHFRTVLYSLRFEK